MRRVRVVSAAVAVGLVLVGCGDGASSSSPAGSTTTTEPTVRIRSSTSSVPASADGTRMVERRGGVDGPLVYGDDVESGEGEEALVAGTLELTDGCLLIVAESDPSAAVAVVWQAVTRWDQSTNEVILPDGSRVAVGNEVAAGGGYHTVGDLGTFLTDTAAIDKARDCARLAGTEGTFVIQHPVETGSSASGSTQDFVTSSLAPGESGVLAVGTHCGVAVLGRLINGYVWRTSEAEGLDWVPHEWSSGPVPPDPIDITVSLSDDGSVLTAELNGREVTYVQDGRAFAEADECA